LCHFTLREPCDGLGFIGSIASLPPGESETLTATASISETTTNVARAEGNGPPGAEWRADSDPVAVSVLPPPPCSASIAFKQLDDDKAKWTLSNDSPSQRATMETFRLVFPAGFVAIKEVKLAGAVFKSGDSDTYPDGVGSGDVIGPDDWTQSNVSKLQLDPGESRTLEAKVAPDHIPEPETAARGPASLPDVVVVTEPVEWDDRLKQMFGGATYQELQRLRGEFEPMPSKPGGSRDTGVGLYL